MGFKEHNLVSQRSMFPQRSRNYRQSERGELSLESSLCKLEHLSLRKVLTVKKKKKKERKKEKKLPLSLFAQHFLVRCLFPSGFAVIPMNQLHVQESMRAPFTYSSHHCMEGNLSRRRRGERIPIVFSTQRSRLSEIKEAHTWASYSSQVHKHPPFVAQRLKPSPDI